jgi:hypothetical protein
MGQAKEGLREAMRAADEGRQYRERRAAIEKSIAIIMGQAKEGLREAMRRAADEERQQKKEGQP